jgi:hypothetical protein
LIDSKENNPKENIDRYSSSNPFQIDSKTSELYFVNNCASENDLKFRNKDEKKLNNRSSILFSNRSESPALKTDSGSTNNLIPNFSKTQFMSFSSENQKAIGEKNSNQIENDNSKNDNYENYILLSSKANQRIQCSNHFYCGSNGNTRSKTSLTHRSDKTCPIKNSILTKTSKKASKKAFSSNLIKETAVNCSMIGPTNELKSDFIFKKKAEINNSSLKKANISKPASNLNHETNLENNCPNHDFCFSLGNIRNGFKHSSTYSCPYEKKKKEISCIEKISKNESKNLQSNIESNDSKLREKKTTGLNENSILINNESLAICSGKQASVSIITSNESEPKKAFSSNLIEETASMNRATIEINCNRIESQSSNFNKEPTLNCSKSSTTNEFNCNRVLSKNKESPSESLTYDSASIISINGSDIVEALTSNKIGETLINCSISSTTNELNENRVLSKNKETASESFACDSGKQASVSIITSNESEPKKAFSSNLIEETASMNRATIEINCNRIESQSSNIIEETASMSGTTIEIDCNRIEILSSNLNEETASMSGTTIEIDCNKILSKKESLAICSDKQVSAPIITSNESKPKEAFSSNLIKETASKNGATTEIDCNRNEALSSNLIAHTTKILLEQKKNINSQQQDSDKSNLNAMLDKKNNKR